MEKKQYTKCKHFLLFDCFKNKKSQLTKCCIKCLDYCKKSRQKTKCIHRRQRSKCKDCCGGHIYEHGRQRSQCKDCSGSRICEHNKIKSRCQDCGGCEICGHNKIKSRCKDCSGGGICKHARRRSSCPTCNHLRHLAGVVRGRVYIALKNDQEMSSKEYLGYNIETFKKHIEQQFTEVMS